MSGLEAATRQLANILEGLRVPYAVMGGLAVRIHALPRPTFDVDVTAAIGRQMLPRLYAAAEEAGFEIPSVQQAGWVDSVRGMPIVKFQWRAGDQPIDIDVFLAETAFQDQLLLRRQRYSAEGLNAWFVSAEDLILLSAEDLILLKLLANRPKDRTDVMDILFIQGDLDETYLRTWAKQLGVEQALAELLESR